MYEGTLGGSKARIKRVGMYSGGGSGSERCVLGVTLSRSSALMGPADLLPSGHNVETWHNRTSSHSGCKHVTTDLPQFISVRVSGGDLMEYVTSHPDVDRLSLVRVFYGSSRSRTMVLGRVLNHFVQDLRPPGSTPNITANPTLLRQIGVPVRVDG